MLDPFAGTGDAVPDALAERLRTLGLVDHHVHGVFTQAPDRASFESALDEASTDPVPAHVGSLDSPVGLALRRWCAPVLGLAPHASADDYWAARCATPHDELSATLLREAGVERWLVDTGLGGTTITSPGRLSELSDSPSHEVLRLEVLAQQVLDDGTDPASYAEELRRRLRLAAPQVVAVKTIAAYRCGLGIDWSRPDERAVATAVAGLGPRTGRTRLADPVLISFGVHEAADLGLPIQVHTGLGDRDLDLHRADPMLLLPLLRSMPPVPLLLLHCWPFHRQAGYLAAAFAHVSFDVGLAVTHLGSRSVELVGEAMELAPFSTQLYSSDGYGLPELHLLGSVLWRRATGLVLGAWVRRGEWSEADAIRVVEMVGAGNARRVYGL